MYIMNRVMKGVLIIKFSVRVVALLAMQFKFIYFW